MPLNKENLAKVRDLIAEHHDQFNYNRLIHSNKWTGRTIIGNVNEVQLQLLSGDCGTHACVAGWASSLSLLEHDKPMSFTDIEVEAQRYLGLNNKEAAFLFWLYPLYKMPRRDLEQATHLEAIKRLNFLINLKEQDRVC